MERLWLPEAESRLTLLYMLNRLGPVTRQQLETFGLRFSMLNFFDLQTNLISLLEQGLVREEQGPLGTRLVLTPEGETALAGFQTRVPASRRAQMDTEAPEWRNRFRQEQETSAQWVTSAEGGRAAVLRLADEGGVQMELLLAGQPLASDLQTRWHREAGAIWREILQALSEGFDDRQVQEGRPEAEPDGAGGWWLRLADNGTLQLTLHLPDGALANHAAGRWEGQRAQLRKMILRKLGG